MRIVSWNINSLRARINRAQAFVERHDPDVLCLQETKVEDAHFPRLAFMDRHITAHGQPTYNGVAILSKTKPDEVRRGFAGNPAPDQARVMAARFGDLWVYNLYVVNGKDIHDPAFLTKRDWIAALRLHISDNHQPSEQVLLVGDFNITPGDLDTHDPVGRAGTIHHTADERGWLADLQSWGMSDMHRDLTEEQVFTWWDYRNLGFQKNEGLRIDLALGTKSVAERVETIWVDRDERKVGDHVEKPSDHAPLVVDIS
jgi:exodeoxyribonuclease-3